MEKKISQKRGQIDKNQATTFAFVAIASIVTVASLVISKGVWERSRYLATVAQKKEVAVKQLEVNKEAVSKLTEEYNKFETQNPNLLGGSIDGEGDKDGSNSTLVLDSLPNQYDFPALTASIEKMLIGYDVESIGGNDESVADSGSIAGTASGVESAGNEIPFSFEVSTSYGRLKELLIAFDKSIRPFSITRIELTGSNSSLKVNVNGKTFYQPDTTLKITEETVQ